MLNKKLDLARQLKITQGESSFRSLRTSGGLYVDKTEQIYNCIRDYKYLFLARPRRFGKSLLCSTIEELLSGNREFFKGLWIDGKDSHWDWQQYPVIKLDMTIAAGLRATEDSVNRKLCQELWRIAQKVYHITMPEIEDDAHTVLRALILALVEKFNKPVVVIIDEYDKPLLDVIDNQEAFISIQARLKSFYEILKAESALLRLVFVTGVFKFSKAGMFSGANNITDLTFRREAATLVGYTQQELEYNFAEGIKALASDLKIDDKTMKALLKERYNGYCFAYKNGTDVVSESVYNPFGINHVFAATELLEEWFLSGSPTILLKKLKAENCKPLLEQELIINAKKLSSPSIPDQFNTLPLLYFGGYLTIKSFDPESELLSFMWPNTEVSKAFTTQLLEELMPDEATTITLVAHKICKELKAQKFDQLKELFNQMLACVGYMLIQPREDLYQLAFFMTLSAGGLKARVEEVTQDGRIDIVIEMHNLVYIIELKIDQSPEKAIQQIKSKDYALKYRPSGAAIWAIGISLAGTPKSSKKPSAAKKPKKAIPKNAVKALAVEAL